MPTNKLALGAVACGAVGVGYVAYKFNKFKKDYQRAKEESRRRREDTWNSFVSGVRFSVIGGCVLLGVAGYYSLKSRKASD